MFQKIFVILVFIASSGLGQTINNVNLLQFKSYMLKVVEETVHDLEDYGWCNLKIPTIAQEFRYQLFGQNTTGTVTYKNGFVISTQHVDVTDSSLQQTWIWDNTVNATYVRLRAQMRLHDLVLGFDVEALSAEKAHRYTSKFPHRVISFDFEIRNYISTHETIITVTGIHPKSTNRMTYIPSDEYSEVLSALYDVDSTRDAVLSWGPGILQPIATNVVVNKVPFPNICYNCPT